MTDKQVLRYTELANRKSFILAHTGISWKPEYAEELEAIDQELAELRRIIDQEHEERSKEMSEEIKIPKMLGLRQASEATGMSYDFLRKLCLQGKIIHVKAGCKYLINMEKLADYLNGEVAG